MLTCFCESPFRFSSSAVVAVVSDCPPFPAAVESSLFAAAAPSSVSFLVGAAAVSVVLASVEAVAAALAPGNLSG